MIEENQLSAMIEINYFLATQVLDKLIKEGLISEEEKNEIHQLNLLTFQPFLAELID